MLSTLQKDMKFENNIMHFAPKEYPNWYGITDIGFIWHNEWSDPELEYEGQLFNANDIQDTLWSYYEEYCKESDKEVSEEGFGEYIRENTDEVYELLNDRI